MRCLGCMKEYHAENEPCPFCGYIPGTDPEKSNHLSPGTVLAGRYLIGRALGSGGFGITYLAWDNRVSRPVAIKEYLPGVFAYRVPGQNTVACYDNESTEKFNAGVAKTVEESNCLARFNSVRGVVSVYNCVEENNTVYIVMEYLDGKTLKDDLAQNGKYTFEEALAIINPILTALSEIHKSDIIHRDISPDNIFLCNDGTVKLIDFGAARAALRDDQKSLSVILKRGYAPKEQYSRHAKQGPWTDVYATAATLYRMLTGTIPPESLERGISDSLERPSALGVAIPPYAEEAILCALAVDAENRTQNAGDFFDALNHTKQEDAAEIEFEEPKAAPKKNIKKIIAGISAFLLIVTLFTGAFIIYRHFSSQEKVIESGVCGNGVSWQYTAENSIIIGGTGKMFDYTNEKDVPWVAFKDKIVSVEFYSGVESIGANSFCNCTALSNIIFCNTVTNIGNDAFYGCISLSEAVLPDGITVIGSNAFAQCSSLSFLHIPDGVTSFGVDILKGTTACVCCRKADGDARTYAESNGIMFTPCNGLHNAEVNTGVGNLPINSETTQPPATLAEGVCGPELRWVLLQDGTLTVSGKGTMDNYWQFNTETSQWSNLQAPTWSGFAGQIKKIVLEDGVTDVGNFAFFGCSALNEITLSQSVTAIGNFAFCNCGALNGFTAPQSLTKMGESAFQGCKSLISVSLACKTTEIPENAFFGCTMLSSMQLPTSLTAVGENAFAECASLAKVKMPASVSSLGKGCFRHCTALTEITIPASTTEIFDYTFAQSGLTEIAIPSHVEIIGNYAFQDCKSLKNIEIANGVSGIGAYAFSGCTSVEKVILPDSVLTVGNMAFADCTALSVLHLPATVETIGKDISVNTNTTVCIDGIIPAAKYGYKFCNGKH